MTIQAKNVQLCLKVYLTLIPFLLYLGLNIRSYYETGIENMLFLLSFIIKFLQILLILNFFIRSLL